jgi:Spy/CpxP family protein refolding chaperone
MNDKNMVLKLMRIVVLTVAALVTVPLLLAQADPQGRAGQGLERLRQAFAELNLTDDQQQGIREAFMAQGERIRNLMTDQSLSRDEKLKLFKELGDELDPKLKSILNDDQYKAWQQKKLGFQSQVEATRNPMGQVKTTLNATDEEWAIISPLLEAVTRKQQELAATIRSPLPTGRLGGRPLAEGIQAPRESQALKSAVEKDPPLADDLKQRMEDLRSLRKQKESELHEAREKLRQVLSLKQEALLLMAGILD